MTEIDILLPRQTRRQHLMLADRPRAANHDVHLIVTSTVDAWPAALAAERHFSHRAGRLEVIDGVAKVRRRNPSNRVVAA